MTYLTFDYICISLVFSLWLNFRSKIKNTMQQRKYRIRCRHTWDYELSLLDFTFCVWNNIGYLVMWKWWFHLQRPLNNISKCICDYCLLTLLVEKLLSNFEASFSFVFTIFLFVSLRSFNNGFMVGFLKLKLAFVSKTNSFLHGTSIIHCC